MKIREGEGREERVKGREGRKEKKEGWGWDGK